MEPSVALRAIRQAWYIVVLAVLGAIATAVLLTMMAPLAYSTSSTYVVSPGTGDTFEVAEAVRTLDTTRGRAIVATYVEILSSDAVQAAAAGELGADPSLLREFQIVAVILPEANVVSVTVTGPNPNTAVFVSEAAGAAAARRFVDLYPIYSVSVLDAPIVPTSPMNRDLSRTIVLAAALGMAVGGLVALAVGLPRVRRSRMMSQRLSSYADNEMPPNVASMPSDLQRLRSRTG